MKRLLIGGFVLLVGVSAAFSETIVPSTIKRVTVFQSQAIVHREAQVKVNSGANDILLELDAFVVDKDSLSARVFGEGEIQGVQYREIFLKELPQEKVKALEQRLKQLKDAKRVLLDEKEVLGKKEAFLNSIINFSQTEVPREIKTSFPKMEDFDTALAFLAKNFQAILLKKQDLDSKVEETDREIKVVEKELATLKVPQAQTKKVIEVLFNSRQEQVVRIEASYLVSYASWQPAYKADVPLSLDGVDLTLFSVVKQKTGETWKQVSFSVSNVIPLRGAGLPMPVSWILDFERPRAAGRMLEMKAKQAPGAPSVAMEEPKKEADFAQAERIALPLSFEYQIPRPIDIESQDKETTLPIFSKKLKGDFLYYALPKTSPLTFLICKASADKELLAGALNVYFGGRYVGKTFLSEKRAGEEFDLNLGADREVKVSREKMRDKMKETFWGMERKNVVRDLAFKITMENLKDKPIKLRVLDSIPVSKTDKIEVKDVKITPNPTEKNYQDKEGVLLWELEMKPGERKEIRIEFTVTYPKDQPISGL